MRNLMVVEVVSTGDRKVPLDFPWINGVHVQVLGDVTNLDNLIVELREIRKMVLRDINKFSLNLKEFSIKITSKEK